MVLYIRGDVMSKLTQEQEENLDIEWDTLKSTVDSEKYSSALRFTHWNKDKLDFQIKSKNQEYDRKTHSKKHHPCRPRRGDVFLAELGQNIGMEINEQHLVVIFQNNKANIFSNTVVVIPISSSGKLYDAHEKIEEGDIKTGRLDILPCKVKTEQIQFMDKARLIHKVATLEDLAIKRVSKRLLKTLDIIGD